MPGLCMTFAYLTVGKLKCLPLMSEGKLLSDQRHAGVDGVTTGKLYSTTNLLFHYKGQYKQGLYWSCTC
jgi:hypothetical protein